MKPKMHIYKENVPVTLDGNDFGIVCTLVRYNDRDYSDIPKWYGHIVFTEEQASFVMELVNSHNDYMNPSDYLQGHFSYEPETDIYTEYDDDEGKHIYAKSKGFDVDGRKVYWICDDWCWQL